MEPDSFLATAPCTGGFSNRFTSFGNESWLKTRPYESLLPVRAGLATDSRVLAMNPGSKPAPTNPYSLLPAPFYLQICLILKIFAEREQRAELCRQQ
ncbi:hypothetical protein H6G17_12700 [Chroococcidiopsis sp. FACHB-1243]|uniref:hypothetical protein n=1 Tax=Chroococcidiopsis sp. [FACHB-1243] TaxID=2692781 RepID=UPI001784DE93|nr:hypothetical protein [Chroococcidiopsis sp. [FACHB-1243]]MBD2306369.1 hypothetical protein [Chroococcidiopsis sp. [FACHB-1243]]